MAIGKKLAKNSIIYFLGKALMLIVSVLCLPIYTSKIDTNAYGYYDLTNTIIVYGMSLLCIEVWTAVLRFSLNKNDDNAKKKIFSTGFFFVLAVIATAIVGFTIVNIFANLQSAILIVICLSTYAINNLIVSFSRSLNKNAAFALSGVASSVVNVSVGIMCVYVFSLQSEALFFALMAGNLAQILILTIVTKFFRYISIKNFSKEIFISMFKFSLPYAISSLFVFLEKDVDKTLISHFMGDDYVGIFSISLKFMAFINVAIDAFALAWRDTTFAIESKEERIVQSTTWINRFFKIAASISFVFIPVIFVAFPILVKGDYASAFNLIPILYVSVFFSICNGLLSNSLLAEMKTQYLLISRFVAACFNLLIVLLTVNSLGLIGICIGYSVGSIVEFTMSMIFCRKKLNMRIEIRSVIYFAVFYAFATAVFYYGDQTANVIIFIILSLVTLVYCREYFLLLHQKISTFLPKLKIVTTDVKAGANVVKGVNEFFKDKRQVIVGILLTIAFTASIAIYYLLSFVLVDSNTAAIVLTVAIMLTIATFGLFIVFMQMIDSRLIKSKSAFVFIASLLLSISALACSLLTDTFYKIDGAVFGSFTFFPTIIFITTLLSIMVIAFLIKGRRELKNYEK